MFLGPRQTGNVFLYAFISVWIHGFLFFGWVILLLFIQFFKFSSFGQLEPIHSGFCVFMTCPHCECFTLSGFFFLTLFGIRRCFGLMLYYPCLSAEISHFSRETWIVLMMDDIQKLRSQCCVFTAAVLLYCFQAFLMDGAGEYMYVFTQVAQW